MATTTRATAGRTAKARKAPPLTPGQKAAATKRAAGLDLSAIARKAARTRLANAGAAARLAAAGKRKSPRRKA